MECLQDQEVGVARPPSSHEDALQPAEGGEGERKGHAAYERAVRQMMGGAPGTAAAAAAVHEGLFADRPAWMSDNPATFTEEQTRQVCKRTASPAASASSELLQMLARCVKTLQWGMVFLFCLAPRSLVPSRAVIISKRG